MTSKRPQGCREHQNQPEIGQTSKPFLPSAPVQTRSRQNYWVLRGVQLREAEILLAQGGTVADACRRIGVTEQSYYRWRKEYGGLKMDQARRMKELEKENARLRRAVSDLTLDKLILQEAAKGNF